MLPRYTYAQCPFCGTRFHEPADTYTKEGWSGATTWHKTLYPLPRDFRGLAHCRHFLGIHPFVDWHTKPVHTLPFITPWYFPRGIATAVVLHALPVCRIEEDRFVPRHTAFALTYFTADKQALDAQRAREESHDTHDREYVPATFAAPGPPSASNAALYDLAAWAARGQLGYLDWTQPDLPLRIGSGTQLPALYHNPALPR